MFTTTWMKTTAAALAIGVASATSALAVTLSPAVEKRMNDVLGIEPLDTPFFVEEALEVSLGQVYLTFNGDPAADELLTFTGNWDRTQGGGEETFNLSLTDFSTFDTFDAVANIYDLLVDPTSVSQFMIVFEKTAATGAYDALSDYVLLTVDLTLADLQGYGAAVAVGEQYNYVTTGRMYDTQALPVGEVPLPASGLLLIGAFAGLARASRRRSV